ncbi:MAG: hypothetical protein HYR75_05475, partial [Gemmatimonadetes bacterium]|nr:hypothetical protein [Gemmatimonadota bacterium]
LVGRLVAQSADTLPLVTSAGRMAMARASVREVRLVHARELHDGEYWPEDPHGTRLFFGPTGRTLAQGEGYFSDLYLFFVNAAVGVTDRFMIGAGMSVFPSGDFFGNNVYYLTPKVSLVRGDAFNVSVGALAGFAGHTTGSAGMVYAAATNGGPDASFTYGAGWAYGGDRLKGDATLLLGGTKRVSRHIALMTEDYVFTGSAGGYVLPMYGVRFVGDRITTDLGLVNFAGRDATPIFPGLPWVGFALRF